jgi:RimJ/RimL family protein N-acetyltransferase
MKMRQYNSKSDFHSIYKMFCEESTSHLVLNRSGHNDEFSFQRWLETSMQKEFNDFMVFQNETDLVGCAYSYNFNSLDGICNITTVVDDRYRGTGIGVICFMKFVDYLFKIYPLRKIYLNIYHYNAISVAIMDKAGVLLEARLREYHFYDGKYEDLLIYSVSRGFFSKHHLVNDLNRT